MAELMTIGAFAYRTGLSVSALRFYAGRRLLVPAEVDDSTGYRRYAENQVGDGVLICNLRRLEMPLSDIALALRRQESGRKVLVERHLHRLEQVVMRANTVAQTLGMNTTNKETTMSATLHTLDLAQALDQVLPASGSDPELPHLMSVLVEGKNGSVRLVATDRHRLAIRDLVPSSLDGEFSGVIAAATLTQWRGSLDEVGELTMTVDDRHLRLVGGAVELTGAVVPVTYPDYERLLAPADDVTRVQTDRQRLLAALEGFEVDGTVVLSTTDGSLRIGGDGQVVDIGASCDGADQEVAINARYAIDATAAAVGAEVVIDIENSLDPVIFRSADDGTFTSLVMPVKLD